MAREVAAQLSAFIRRELAVRDTTGETCNEWFKRYHDKAERGEVGRKNKGRPQVTVDDRRARYRRWIAPHIGHLPIKSVGPDDLRKVVKSLDEQIRARLRSYDTDPEWKGRGRRPGLAPKSGLHIWNECTNAFRESVRSKHDDLRVRKDNPAADVEGPTGGEKREQAALYPSELLALLSCEGIPRRRQLAYAIAAYTGMRQGELRNLMADCVDLAQGCIYVRSQRQKGQVRTTKTAAGRRIIPIPDELRPLLESLVEGAVEGRPLVRLPPAEDCAEKVRDDLVKAGCDREDLFADDAHRQHFTFHGLRHSAITHWAVAGRSIDWIMSAAGHESHETMRGYLDRAAMVRAGFGTPHPPLPERVLSIGPLGPIKDRADEKLSDSIYFQRPQRELNPCYRRERPVS